MVEPQGVEIGIELYVVLQKDRNVFAVWLYCLQERAHVVAQRILFCERGDLWVQAEIEVVFRCYLICAINESRLDACNATLIVKLAQGCGAVEPSISGKAAAKSPYPAP